MTEQADERGLEARVRRDTIIDTRLDGHDRRLASINGQLERGARATEIVSERLQTLTTSVVDLRSELHTKAQVDMALREQTDQTAKQQVSRREFWLGVMVVVVAILSVAVNAGLL